MNQCLGMTNKKKRCKNQVIKAFCHIHLPAPHWNEVPDECSICSEKIVPENSILSCGHFVHWTCLDQWEKGYRCPLCNASLPEFSRRKPSVDSVDSDDVDELIWSIFGDSDPDDPHESAPHEYGRDPRINLCINIPAEDYDIITRLLADFYDEIIESA